MRLPADTAPIVQAIFDQTVAKDGWTEVHYEAARAIMELIRRVQAEGTGWDKTLADIRSLPEIERP